MQHCSRIDQAGRLSAIVLTLLLIASCSSGGEPDDASTTTSTAERTGEASVTPGGSSNAAAIGSLPGMEAALASGINVSAVGSAETPADIAHLVLIPEADGGAFFGGSSRSEDWEEADVVEALEALDVGTDDMKVTEPINNFDYGPTPGEIVVRLPVDADLTARAEAIEEAVDDVVGIETSGLRWKVTSCDEGLAEARADAIERGLAQAQRLAAAAGADVGEVRSVTAGGNLFASFPFGPSEASDGDPCNLELGADAPVTSFLGESTPIEPLDAEPVAHLAVTLQITYELADIAAPARWLTAGGSASIAAPADIAIVEVIVAGDDEMLGLPFGGGSAASVDESEVAEVLEPLGVTRDQVRVRRDASSYLGGHRISVEVAVAELVELGEEILDALEDELELEGASGVRFASSDCRDLVDEATGVAIEEASAAIGALASDFSVEVGEIVGVTDVASGFGPGTDPCSDVDDGEALPNSIEELFMSFMSSSETGLKDFDAEPLFEARVEVLLTRAVTSS